jgi:hypothetical protein
VSIADAITPIHSGIGSTPGVGMKVAVRNRYLGTWSAGFEVATLHVDGYSIRRTSDGAVLPEVIAFEDVREPWGPDTVGLG